MLPRFLKDRLWAFSKRGVRTLVYALGGLGDELMLTAVAREARRQGRPIHVLTNRPEVWKGNLDPLSLETSADLWFYADRRGWTRARLVHLLYQTGNHRHIAAQMSAHLGLVLPDGWRPVLAHTSSPRAPRLLVLQNSCRGALYAATTKEWAAERWCELATHLARDHQLVQIGTPQDPPLPGTRDLRGRTTLHEAADLLAGAAAFIGLESGLMHVAAATSTPSVIIYGGRSRPHETGYSFNTNLTRSPACAGCGLNDGCPHHRVCLDIPVDEVEAAVRALVNKSRS